MKTRKVEGLSQAPYTASGAYNSLYRPRHGAKLPPPTSAGGLPKGSLPTSMEGEPSTDVVFGGFSDKVPPFALKKKTALPAKMADASCQHGG